MATGVTTRTRNRLARLIGRVRLKPAVVVHAPATPATAPARRPTARRNAIVALVAGLVVFAALQAALSGVASFTRVVADPGYADKVRWLRRLEQDAPPGTPQVIFLGTSRTGFGFAAGRTQRAAADAGTPAVVFNFGLPGAGPVAHRIYLNRLLADGHRPDLLVLDVLPPLLSDMPGGPPESRIISGDTLTRDEINLIAPYGMPADRLHGQWGRAAATPFSAHRFKLTGRLFPKSVPWQLRFDAGRTADPNGWNPTFTDTVTPQERARGVESTVKEYVVTTKLDLPAGPAVAALRDTLAVCRAEGIPVALVILPETTTFRGLYPPETEGKLKRFLADLTAEFGCPVADAREWLPDDAFFDAHHLLRPGAIAFTDRLNAEFLVPLIRDRQLRRAGP